MNVGSCYYPPPHKDWGQCAEELLFHTSRYALHARTYLACLSGDSRVSLSGYQADLLNSEQKFCMAWLLSRPPSQHRARAIINLIDGVRAGNDKLPAQVESLLGHSRPGPHLRAFVVPPGQSRGLEQVSAEDVILHLSARYHFPLRIRSKVVWLDSARCNQLLNSRRIQIRRNMLEALRYLNRSGFQVHLRQLKASRAA